MMKPIVIVGDIVVDVTLKTASDSYKLRLGGITHAARGAWALGRKYSLGYFAPSYLERGIHTYFSKHGCEAQTKLGDVTGAPYVFLISEVKEVGDQGYEFLLREELEILYSNENLGDTSNQEVLFISGNYNPNAVLADISGDSAHIDLANNVQSFEELKSLRKVFASIFISTSSALFKKHFESTFMNFAELFRPYCKRIVLKENRGGSRGYDFTTGETVEIPSQTQPIVHSVGVGDIFDVAYICHYSDHSFKEALTFSSWIATEYALTTFPDDFKIAVDRVLKVPVEDLINLGGVFIPWERRKPINIYVAGPDFDFIDTTEIDRLVSCLTYHNFSPRRPIKENGQMEPTADATRKRELFDNDIKLMNECALLVAIILNNDPGTFVEIGFAQGIGMPAIVYDPYNLANNCMLSELPTLVSSNLDEIVSEVFKQAAKLK